jgi:two-component system, LytTR family, sensor kinase
VEGRTRSREPRQLIRSTLLIVGGWTLVGILTSEQQRFALARAHSPVTFERILIANFCSMYLWAAFTPAMVALGRRFRVSRATWPLAVTLHVLFAFGFAFADVVFMRLMLPWSSPFDDRMAFSLQFVRSLFANLVSYLAVVAITHASEYARMLREREVTAARLSAQLSAARLQALQAQLRPHFLFNTLNTIAEQVYTDAAGADRMLTRLGALLRASLGAAGTNEVPLRDELALLSHYLEIVRVRFRDRLTVDVDVDPAALDVLVPTLLLQPLVENALQHGIEPMEEGGRIEIVARRRIEPRSGESLEIEVRDDGAGLPNDDPTLGVGTKNTRDRLEHLYGEDASLVLRPRIGGGTIAAIKLPVRAEGRASRAEARDEALEVQPPLGARSPALGPRPSISR